MKKYKIIVPVISVCVIIALLLTFRMSLAYLMDAEWADNIITIGKVDVSLNEDKDPDHPYKDSKIVAAGESVIKAPKLINEGTEDEYVFLRIAVPVKDVTLLYEQDKKDNDNTVTNKEGTKIHTTDVANHSVDNANGNGKAREEIYRMIATGTNPAQVSAADNLEPKEAPCLDFGYNAGHIKNANDTNKDGWVYLKRKLDQTIDGETYDLYYFGYNRRLQYNSDQTEKAKTIPLFDQVQLKSFIDEELITGNQKANVDTYILVRAYAIQADSLDKGNAGDLNAIERDAYLNQVQLTKIFGIVERKAGEA